MSEYVGNGINPLYYRYWGKAERDGQRFHLLPYHCLDVAAVVAVWWETSATIRRSFKQNSNLTEAQVRAWILFFSTLHDYGKYDVRFQLKDRSSWEALYPSPMNCTQLPSVCACNEYKHGENGLWWFKQDYFSCLDFRQSDPLFAEEPSQWKSWKPWVEAVTGHHGHVKDAAYMREAPLPSTCDNRLADVDRLARTEWLEDLVELFLYPAGLSLNDSPPPPSPLLAGLCSVADWLASRCDDINFTFHQHPEPLSVYFERKVKEDARRVFDLSGIEGTARGYGGVQPLLPEKVEPRPLQARMDELPLEPGLTIIEAPTGSGKTEAALAYAWRLLAAGLADSLIFALPTQATANAMLGRLEMLATKLFEESPNLLLAHGSARFNEKFAELRRKGLYVDGETDGWVQCGEWLAESRKRVFLGQIGVCTIDQVLISVLPVKHRFVRGFGVGRSVLVVDEVHAYDAYMYGLLEEVLRQQRAAGATAVLLSATLPAAQKRQLSAVWQAEEQVETVQEPYPLITWVGENTSCRLSLEPHEQPEFTGVRVECLRTDKMEPDDILLKRIVAAAESGAQVAVICNLVYMAQGTYHRVKELTSAPTSLFHARYRFKDRQARETDVITRFGPDGNREHGHILVATQVVEQSLDIDFDWIVTQLCPVDLLFQRMGRLHRHTREWRPDGFTEPVCTVLLPENGDYGLTGRIYSNTRVLWRTEQKLVSAPEGVIVFPAAYRDWIEEVYQEEPWKDEPENTTKYYMKFKDDLDVSKMKALQQIYSAANPFDDTDEKVTAVTRDGEMNLTVIPYIDSPDGRRLLDGELVDKLPDFRKPEEIARNSIGVPGSWKGWLEALCETDEEKRYWLAMTEQEGSFMREGDNVIFRYHSDTGLGREK
ncbi:MAG TPA: CRISPR-associated helicase/endonuclease Cas3 [Acidobacteriota bacterium]|nr:CRISPR-associated helicase/endonuclease Cas3 [Acidobacteriota bacterium]